MTTAPAANQSEPGLSGQTVIVIGGSSGIGLETARRARAEGPASSWPAAIPTTSNGPRPS